MPTTGERPGPELAAERLPSRPTGPPSRTAVAVAGFAVTAFGFLIASFPARSADAWVHAAAGRQMLTTPTTARPGWLYDLGVYALDAAAGGTGLVVAKAMLVSLAGLIAWRAARVGPGWVVPTASVLLALFAAGTRLGLQPSTASVVYTAILVWLLRPAAPRPSGWLPPWPFVVLFLAWANTDAGFALGLLAVALAWVGDAFDGDGRVARRLVAAVALAAACVVTPSPVGTFRPAAEWLTRSIILFTPGYLSGPGQTPAGQAVFPLLGLGLLSFVVNRGGWRWGRFLPWLALAAVTCWNARAVPVFALFTGPVLAWNLTDLLTRRPAGSEWTRLGRFGTAVAAAALLVCSWPGWLQAPPYEPRRWAVEPSPGLRAAAEAVNGWKQEGAVGLHLAPETAAAFARFCPNVRVHLDPDGKLDRARAAGVRYVVVHDPDRGRFFAALEPFVADPARWPLLVVAGDVAVFGWKDAGPLPVPEYDSTRRAFHPADAERATEEPPAWAAGRPWDAFWKYAPPRTGDRDAAAVYLFRAEAARPTAQVRQILAWQAGQMVGLIGSAAPPAVSGLALLRPPVSAEAFERFTLSRDDLPPADLYLAVRAARRAVATDPNDAAAFLLLGECYVRLLGGTRERAWAVACPEVYQLRRAQAATAWARAVALNPNLAEAHLKLGRLYRDQGYFDLAVTHLRAHRALTRNPDEAGDRELARLAKLVDERTAEQAKEAAGSRVLDRAALALDRGLAGIARDTLLGSDVAAFGAQGMAMELELLLRTGRARDVIEWTDAAQKPVLGGAQYHWVRAQALAAIGAYAAAEDECAQVAAEAVAENPRALAATAAGQWLIDQLPAAGWAGVGFRAAATLDAAARAAAIRRAVRQRADALALRGLLLLERGHTDEAEVVFRTAAEGWADDGAAGPPFNARGLTRDALGWIADAADKR